MIICSTNYFKYKDVEMHLLARNRMKWDFECYSRCSYLRSHWSIQVLATVHPCTSLIKAEVGPYALGMTSYTELASGFSVTVSIYDC